MVSFLVETTLRLPLWAELYLLMPNQTSVSAFARLKLSVKRKHLLFQITFLRSFEDHFSRGNNHLLWLWAPIDICDNCGCLTCTIDAQKKAIPSPLQKKKKPKNTSETLQTSENLITQHRILSFEYLQESWIAPTGFNDTGQGWKSNLNILT